MLGSVPVSAISDQPSSLVIGAAATDRTAVLKSNWLSPLDRQTGRQRERAEREGEGLRLRLRKVT